MLSLQKELKLNECVVPYCNAFVNDGNSRLFPKHAENRDLFEWWLKLVSNEKLKLLQTPAIEKFRVCKKHFNRFDVPTNLLPSCASNDLKKYLLSKRKNVIYQKTNTNAAELPILSIGSTEPLKAKTIVKNAPAIPISEKLLNSNNGNVAVLVKNSEAEPELNTSGGSVAIEKVIIAPKIPPRNPTFLSKDFLKNVHIDPEKVIVLSDESDSLPNSDDEQGSSPKLLPLARSTPLKTQNTTSLNKPLVKRIVIKKPTLSSAKLSETAIRAVQNNMSKWKHILMPNTVRGAEQQQQQQQQQPVDQSKTFSVKTNNNSMYLVLNVLKNNNGLRLENNNCASTSTANNSCRLPRLLPNSNQNVTTNQNQSKTISATPTINDKKQILIQKILNDKKSANICNVANSRNISGSHRSIEQIRFESDLKQQKQNEYFKKCLDNEMKILRRDNMKMRTQLNTLRKNMCFKNKQLVLLKKEVRAEKDKYMQLLDLPEHLRRFFLQQLQHSRTEGNIVYSEEEKQLAFVVTGCDRNLYKNYQNYFYAPELKTMARWRKSIDKELDRRKKELYVYVNDPNQIECIKTAKSKKITYRDYLNDNSEFNHDLFDEDSSNHSSNSDSDSN